MAFAFDSSVEREFAGTGASAANVVAVGAAAANDEYLFIVATATSALSGSARRVSSVNVSEDGVGGGGDLVEYLRLTMARGAADVSADVIQLWAIRNNDIASLLDVESAINLKCLVSMNHANFHDIHWGFFVVYSAAMDLVSPLLDLMQGGVCQISDENTGDADATFNYDAASVAIVQRAHGPSTSLGVHTPTNYNVFDTVFATHSRVSAVQTSVIRVGIGGGIEPGMGLNKDNTGNDTFLNLQGMRFSESVVGTFTAPVLSNVETQECFSGDLVPVPPAPKIRRARAIHA